MRLQACLSGGHSGNLVRRTGGSEHEPRPYAQSSYGSAVMFTKVCKGAARLLFVNTHSTEQVASTVPRAKGVRHMRFARARWFFFIYCAIA